MTAPWPALREGALVAVIAPAGPAEPLDLALVAPLYARHGLRARLYPSCHAREGYLAGSDALRLADLHAAFADAEVAGVHCLRGGYGSGRLLGSVNTALLAAHDKPFIGYSDITALHALRNRLGLLGLHAPMPASDLMQPGHEADAAALFALLRGGWLAGSEMAPARAADALVAQGRAHGMAQGTVQGRLVGGNLSLVAALIGTPYACPVQGAVLFLEDVNEEPYRIDRLLGQLQHAGVLAAAGGFLLGSFAHEESSRAVLESYLLPLRKPVLGGWPAGHCTPNAALPLGAQVLLDAARGTLTLLQDVIAS